MESQKKHPEASPGWKGKVGLKPYHVGSLRSTSALDNFKFNAIAFIESAESISADGRIVYKNIPAAILLQKPITLLRTEPFNASDHSATFPFPQTPRCSRVVANIPCPGFEGQTLWKPDSDKVLPSPSISFHLFPSPSMWAILCYQLGILGITLLIRHQLRGLGWGRPIFYR